MKTSKLITAAILAASVLGFSNSAQAALVSCPSSFTTDPTAKVEDRDDDGGKRLPIRHPTRSQ